jgi:hypothetical protein
MLTPCQEIARTIGELFTCSTVNDYIRIRTPLLYPDGDVIDIYLKEKEGQYILTDLGETLRWLRMQTISEKRSEKQETLIQDTLLTHGVEKYKGMLIIRIQENENLASAVTTLSQAAFRVSDIWFTFRTRAFESIIEEVAEFLTEKQIPFEQNKKFAGRSGRSRKVDFCTEYRQQTSLIDVLSTASVTAGNSRADNIFTVWSDLSYLQEGNYKFISLFDDTIDIWKLENITLLEQVSNVAYWSRKAEFQEMLLTNNTPSLPQT